MWQHAPKHQERKEKKKKESITEVIIKAISGFWSDEDEINWNSRREGDSTIVG